MVAEDSGTEHSGTAEGGADRADCARAAELARNLAAVRARIAAACAAAGREPDEVRIIAVTKTYPAADVIHLYRAGLREFGENRDQEAAAKAAATRAELPGLTWHFIGQLQTNKVRSVISYADVVHSVDRLKLVHALDDAAARAGRSPLCLIQVNLDPAAAGRGGAEPGDVERIADAVAGSGALRLGGLMAVAPLGADPGAAFERLADIAAKVRGAHAGAVSLSAGMSGDLEAAVAVGATHVRIGSALLGARPPLR
ncbi:MAG TPA: YggS family pyridoxal phosphate-dependent enzyme [Actinocrinis sp.]|nr:YggS family pyridoxal phosphate-dependent enzyme [Actinocrinis sp.]